MINAHSMSLWSLVLNASVVVQGILVLLFMASILSWTVIFSRRIALGRAQKLAQHFESDFWSSSQLQALYARVQKNPNNESGLENLFRAGLKEFARLRDKNLEPDVIMQGVQRALRVALAHEQASLEQHLTMLASVGSTSPYVGLLGTVWGIMNAFIGLANVHQATLATVAPGIAEALITTAIGLFAAIPAVLAFNAFSSRADALLNRYETFADEFSGILHRDAHAGRR